MFTKGRVLLVIERKVLKVDNFDKCPDCGNAEIGKGKLSGYAVLTPLGKILSMGSPIIADVCTNCGTIIKMKVEKPEKFKDR